MLSGRSCLSMLAARKRHLGTVPFVGYSNGRHSANRLLTSSSKSPPSGTEGNEEKQKRSKGGVERLSDSRKKKEDQHLDPQIPVQRFKTSKRKEWSSNNNVNTSQQKQSSLSVVQTTQYSCRRRPQQQQLVQRHTQDPLSQGTTVVSETQRHHPPSILKSIDASALLNPRQFCAASAKSTHTHNVSRSINGTDAARRLLRGKKECLLAARKMINNSSPLMLTGHNVPTVLIQHFVNMGDQLLRHYGPDAVECSFHNYHQVGTSSSSSGSSANRTTSHDKSSPAGGDGSNNDNDKSSTVTLPLHVRVRQRDSTNACLPPPSAYDTRIYDNNHVDWDHHLELYLTVMQNFANPLGKIFDYQHHNNKRNKNTGHPIKDIDNASTESSTPPAIDKYDLENDDDYDFTSSPLLFDSLPPRWNVDILKGEYYNLQYVRTVVDNTDDDTMVGTVTDRRPRDKNGHRDTTTTTTTTTTTNCSTNLGTDDDEGKIQGFGTCPNPIARYSHRQSLFWNGSSIQTKSTTTTCNVSIRCWLL
jgi:hypothetical protein